jgi:biotin carboxyl carrier protein
VRQNVYAGAKGRVSEVCVQHGSLVTEGEVLVRLRDPELEIGITDATGQLATTTSRIESLRQSRIEGKGISLEERSRVAADLAEAEEKQRSLTKQLELLRGKEKELAVCSPIAGQVITWDLDKRLANLPVQRGHMLLQVADLGAAWQLELHMPEHRMGHVARAWQAKQQAKNADDRKVEVEFQLATNPGRTYRGTVREIELNAEVRGEEGSSVLVKVEIDKKELPALRPGTTVTGKVYCGIRPLGYVWLHDVWAFIQSRIIFRYF